MKTDKPNRLKVFFKDARVLSASEISQLPEAKRNEIATSGDAGVWLEVDASTADVTEKANRLCVPTGEAETEDRGIWLDLFCPEARCLMHSSTEAP